MALEDELRDTNELLRQFVSTAGGQVRRGSSSAARSAGPGFVFQSTAAAASTLSKALGIGATTASALGSSLLGFNKNIRSAGDLLKTVFAGTVLGGLAAVVSDTIDVYKEFIGIGQSFNGQMINMAATAADTSQSMEQMIKGFKAAGAAGAVLGIEQFSRLSSAVRASSRQFGSFGLTIEETNEYLGDQIETMRALGVLDNITHHETITNFQELQNQTLALSSVTGKSREEILKQTMAMQKNNAILSGVLAGVPDQIRGSIQKSLQNATNVFAALPGQTGEMLNTALTSSLALGSSFMNEQFGALATMAPQLGLAIDDIAKAAKNGGDTAEAAISAVDAMQDISGEQLSYLSALAAGGDQAATELLQMYSSVKSINTDALRERIKQKQRFGGIEQEFLNFQQNFSILSGEFRGMILKFFQPLFSKFNSLGNDGGVLSKFTDYLKDFGASDKFKEWGTQLAEWLENILPTANELSDWMARQVSWLQSWFSVGEDTKSKFNTIITDLSTTVNDVVLGFGKFIGILDKDGNFDIKGFKDDFIKTLNEISGLFNSFKTSLMSLLVWMNNKLSVINAGFLTDAQAKEFDAARMGVDTTKRESDIALAQTTIDSFKTANKSSWFDIGLGLGKSDEDIRREKEAQMSVQTNVNEIITKFLEDKQIDRSEKEQLQTISQQNSELQKMILDQLRVQTNIQGQTLEKTVDQVNATYAIKDASSSPVAPPSVR